MEKFSNNSPYFLFHLKYFFSSSSDFLGHPDICCFSFVTFKIPDKEILEVVKTHSSCPRKGYV
uniref:Chemokine interleukin-8-like domain-containing protein n=1 Tax=Pygocentrus nattereri TaxID=42514 RepID=A0A3B4DSV2_PYGNA